MDKTERIIRLVRWGSGLSFRIPAAVRREMDLKRGDYLDLAIVDKDTIIAKRLKVVASDKFEERIDDTLPKINYGK